MRHLLFVVPALVFAGVGFGSVSPARSQSVDLPKIFRCAAKDATGIAKCEKARDLILNNCTLCHTFVPIVMQKYDSKGWTALLSRHVMGGRVKQLSGPDVATIHDYLSENFNGKLPPPPLPPALAKTWTSY
jgi:hypothetical protein